MLLNIHAWPKLRTPFTRDYMNRLLLAIDATTAQTSTGNDNNDEETISFDAADTDTLQVTEILAEFIPSEDIDNFCDTVQPVDGNDFFPGRFG